MEFKSAKDWFAAHNGKRVLKSVSGVATVDDWPETVARVRSQLLAQDCPAADIQEDETALKWPGGFLLKPKFRKLEAGTLQVRSADYAFTPDSLGRPVYGDKKGARIEGAALVKSYDNGLIVRFEAERA